MAHRIPTLLFTRPADATGPAGLAWDVSHFDRGTPDQEATIAAWIVHLPASHPIWPTYLFSVIHLREMPGLRAPNLEYPEAEHEFLIVALDPDGHPGHPLSADDRDSWRHLVPINVCVQFDAGRGDEEVKTICAHAVLAALAGAGVEPDDDASTRPYWAELIRNAADHARGAHDR